MTGFTIQSLNDFISMINHNDKSITMASASEDVWYEILSKRPDLSADIAMNKCLPSNIIDLLIDNPTERVRSIVAMKRSLTVNQFFKLGVDPAETVRARIACNKKTPIELLVQLSNDDSSNVSLSANKQLELRGKKKKGEE